MRNNLTVLISHNLEVDIDDLDPDDFRRNNERFQGENFQKNLELVAEVDVLARSKGSTPAQVALAWILAKAPHTIAIPGTRKASRLDENAAATQVELSNEDVTHLDSVIPVGAAAGLRYPEYAMKMLNL